MSLLDDATCAALDGVWVPTSFAPVASDPVMLRDTDFVDRGALITDDQRFSIAGFMDETWARVLRGEPLE